MSAAKKKTIFDLLDEQERDGKLPKLSWMPTFPQPPMIVRKPAPRGIIVRLDMEEEK